MRFDIVLEKRSKVKLNLDTAKKQLKEMADEAERNRTFGFKARVGKIPEPELVFDDETNEQLYLYTVTIRLQKRTSFSKELSYRHFDAVMKNIVKIVKKYGWTYWDTTQAVADDGSMKVSEINVSSRPAFVLPELTNDVLDTYFHGIYEREPHIRLIWDSARMSMDSLKARKDGKPAHRSHILLKGKPASCKTTLFERFKDWFDEEGTVTRSEDESPPRVERVIFIDGPTLSKAGLENYLIDLAEMGNLPEFLVIEEIEKQNMDNLLTLLSVMGSGYVRKLNAHRNSNAVADVVIWATCNDEKILRTFRQGALWSRFTHQLHCQRPSKGLMEKILLEKTTQLGGNPDWVKEIMKFSYETLYDRFQIVMDDPRQMIGLLDGGDRLLSGAYQADKIAVIESELREASPEAFSEEAGLSG